MLLIICGASLYTASVVANSDKAIQEIKDIMEPQDSTCLIKDWCNTEVGTVEVRTCRKPNETDAALKARHLARIAERKETFPEDC